MVCTDRVKRESEKCTSRNNFEVHSIFVSLYILSFLSSLEKKLTSYVLENFHQTTMQTGFWS